MARQKKNPKYSEETPWFPEYYIGWIGIRNCGQKISIVFPHIRPAGIIILCSLQMRVLLENTTFLLHKVFRIAGIIRDAGIIRGRALYEEIRYASM